VTGKVDINGDDQQLAGTKRTRDVSLEQEIGQPRKKQHVQGATDVSSSIHPAEDGLAGMLPAMPTAFNDGVRIPRVLLCVMHIETDCWTGTSNASDAS
jgi:hypothetical protein